MMAVDGAAAPAPAPAPEAATGGVTVTVGTIDGGTHAPDRVHVRVRGLAAAADLIGTDDEVSRARGHGKTHVGGTSWPGDYANIYAIPMTAPRGAADFYYG